MADDVKKTQSTPQLEEAKPEAAKVETPAPSTPDQTPEPTQPTGNVTDPKTAPEGAPTPEPQTEKAEKSKLSFLSKLKKFSEKQPDPEVGSPFDSNSDGYVSAREAINALDKEIQVNNPSEDEVAAQLRDQLQEQAEYYVIRVRKSGFMLVAGTILLLVWLVILMAYWQKNQMPNWRNLIPGMQSSTQPSPSSKIVAMGEPTPSPTTIRVKTMANDARLDKITSILRDNGYASVDVETVTEIVEPGVMVAVKQGDSELLAKLLALLITDYRATSSATTLSADSDFAGVIWLGKN